MAKHVNQEIFDFKNPKIMNFDIVIVGLKDEVNRAKVDVKKDIEKYDKVSDPVRHLGEKHFVTFVDATKGIEQDTDVLIRIEDNTIIYLGEPKRIKEA